MHAATADTLIQFGDARQASDWLHAKGCTSLSSDSRRLGHLTGLLAWRGQAFDGRRHVKSALLSQQVRACVVDADGAQDFGFDPAHVACVSNLKQLAGEIAHHFYGQPSAALDVIAVTGTNGKTSTAWWLSQAMAINCADRAARESLLNSEQQTQSIRRLDAISPSNPPIKCLMVGTLGHGQVPHITSGELTTPDAVALHDLLAQAREHGATHAVIEASSIGIVEHRMAGVQVRVAMFTNLTHDHLDYHGDMASYWRAKRKLFDAPGLGSAIVNIDDTKGAQLAAELIAASARSETPLDVWTISIQGSARLVAQNINTTPTGMRFDVVLSDPKTAQQRHAAVKTPSFGRFNVSNLLGVIAAQLALGIELDAATRALAILAPVPGRLEIANPVGQSDGPIAVIDYAHTPDALEKALAATRELAHARGGKLWCVFGCGGNRDATKRPLMASAAQRGADHVVLTNDNPRNESDQDIASHVLAGFGERSMVTIELNRAKAIETALSRADKADVVLIAGKGHEAYQEIAGIKHPFSDIAVARSVMKRLDAEQVSA